VKTNRRNRETLGFFKSKERKPRSQASRTTPGGGRKKEGTLESERARKSNFKHQRNGPKFRRGKEKIETEGCANKVLLERRDARSGEEERVGR